jgi:DNA invertase Pin-like site-specific DNA recombinase
MPSHPGPIRAVAYFRMSTGRQEKSIPEQRDWARRAAKAHNVEVVRDFEDPAIPGSEIEDRPGLMEMIDFAEAEHDRGHPIQAIVVWDPDRLSRASSIRTAAFLDRLMGAGVSRLLHSEGWIDFEDDVDLTMFNIKQDLGRKAYSKSLAKNVTRSGLNRAREGRWVAGATPYGYAIGLNHKLVPGDLMTAEDLAAIAHRQIARKHLPIVAEDLAERLKAELAAKAATVRWMFHHYVNTAASLGDLAGKLNSEGKPPPRSGRWTRYTVRELLVNPAYVGDLVWNSKHRGLYYRVTSTGKRDKDGNAEFDVTNRRGGYRDRTNQTTAEEDRVIVENAHPPLIDRETFAAAAKKMGETKWQLPRTVTGGNEWLLSGLLHCGDCGGRMVGHVSRPKRPGGRVYEYKEYVCHANVRNGPGTCKRNAIKQEIVLRAVAGLLRDGFTNPKKLAQLRKQAALEISRGADQAAADRRRMESRLKQIDKSLEAQGMRYLTCPAELMNEVAAAAAKLKAERAELAGELSRNESATAEGDRWSDLVHAALRQLQFLEEKITEAPSEEVRDVLYRLVHKITVHFEHTQRPDGKFRNTPAGLDLELQPEAVHLLGGSGFVTNVRTESSTPY